MDHINKPENIRYFGGVIWKGSPFCLENKKS